MWSARYRSWPFGPGEGWSSAAADDRLEAVDDVKDGVARGSPADGLATPTDLAPGLALPELRHRAGRDRERPRPLLARPPRPLPALPQPDLGALPARGAA